MHKHMQGVFNGVSAGMLLYISFVQLIAEDFSRRELVAGPQDEATPDGKYYPGAESAGMPPELRVVEQPVWLQLANHAALYLGAASMAVLALWA
jgi:hypothetical protein